MTPVPTVPAGLDVGKITDFIDCPDHHPLCPDQNREVETGQSVDIIQCPDRPDRPDQIRDADGEKSRVQKKSSVAGLAERLRQNRLSRASKATVTYASTDISNALHSSLPVSLAVGTVGTLNKNSDLTPSLWSGQWSGRSGQWVGQPNIAPSPAVLPEQLQVQQPQAELEDGAVEPYVPVPQSIPHDVMAAGLLAASLIRPRLVVDNRQPVEDEVASTWALGLAWLRRMLPLPSFSSDRWSTVVCGCAWLLEHHAADMRRLGWSAEDGFGVHPVAPGGAVRCYGLGVLLNGGIVVEMTKQDAVIERPNGARQTFMRSGNTGAIPIWNVQ